VAKTRKAGAAGMAGPNASPSDGMLPADYVRARRLLARRDPVIGALMRTHGACGLARAQREDPFHVLVQAIISQQLSTKAARTIGRRLVELHGGVLTPQAVAATPDLALRGVGLSSQKLRYLRDLCEKVQDGSLMLHSLTGMSDSDVIAALTQVKGIGRWTAEMFLMFSLMRPDVLPVDDLGLRRAMERAYNKGKDLTKDEMREIGAPWAPYRSCATWYLWRSLDEVEFG